MSTLKAGAACLDQVGAWNSRNGVGTAVRTPLRPGEVCSTRTPAMALFGHRAAVYLEGSKGYFELSQLQVLTQRAGPTAPASGLVVMFPGQGAQHRGMGKALFDRYPVLTQQASERLGYSIERLCVDDPLRQLPLTQFTQPALYVVGALAWQALLDDGHAASRPDFLMGHSLGEYNALNAAGVFDFETGLRLVMERGRLMALASGGAMAAVLGADAQHVRELLAHHRLTDIDLSNLNTPTQCVIAGPVDSLALAFECLPGPTVSLVPLKVSAAFHSRYMEPTRAEFAAFLRGFEFQAPRIPVIANTSAAPHAATQIAATLCAQITSPVLWNDSVRHVLAQGRMEFHEVGSTILSRMVAEIRSACAPTGVPPDRPDLRERSP